VTFLFTILSAVLPSLLLMYFFYRSDLFPEPPGVLMTTFGLGFAIILPIVFFAVQIEEFTPDPSRPMWAGLFTAFLVAAVPEEIFKYLVIVIYCARNSAFDEPMDGVVYGATASLGFATLENILYVVDGGWTVALIRAFTAVPAHACLGAILGYYVGRAGFRARYKGTAARGLAIAVLLHGLYDFPLLSMEYASQQAALGGPAPEQALPLGWLFLVFAAVFFYMVYWTLRTVGRLRREQLSLLRNRRVRPGI